MENERERTIIHGHWPPDMDIPDKYRPRLPDGIAGTYDIVINDESRFSHDSRFPDIILEFVGFAIGGGLAFHVLFRGDVSGRLVFSILDDVWHLTDLQGNTFADLDEIAAHFALSSSTK